MGDDNRTTVELTKEELKELQAVLMLVCTQLTHKGVIGPGGSDPDRTVLYHALDQKVQSALDAIERNAQRHKVKNLCALMDGDPMR